MRVSSFSDGLRISALSLYIMLFVAVQLAVADVGGGKGYPATPWRKEGPKSILELEEAKNLAATYQTLSVAPEPGDEERKPESIDFERVSLVPSPFHEGDVRLYVLTGKTRSGETVAISFSQMESFSVISKNDRTITLSVTVWPDISSEELLREQPTYKELYAGYRRDVVLNVDLEFADGRVQVLEGEWQDNTLPLGRLQVGSKAGFYGGHPHMAHPLRFWWAIPSVANDEDYPFRMIPKM
ncbi:MAG: hypothetical protein KKA54_09965 [Proteobacteria bacterium]|nr:hypothetical protein [Pseudomonadota bacterium]MBU0966692.1 hypothetical protein [Pseudomonadota bacterium]